MKDDFPHVVPDDDGPSIVPGDDVDSPEDCGEDASREDQAPRAGATGRAESSPDPIGGGGSSKSEGGWTKHEDIPDPWGGGAGYKDVPDTDSGGTEERLMPEVVNAASWCATPPALEPVVIEGLLRKRAKMVLGGSSKSRKSWTLIQLALCLSSGLPFLGMPTRESKVLYVNMELPEAEMCARVREVAAALGCGLEKLYVWNLRGHAQPLEALVNRIVFVSQKHGIEVIILDPIYKVLGERSENSNEDVAGLLNNVDDIAERSGAAFIFAHHFAKGAQGGKFVEDRISGAGAWWRDPDAGIFMTPLEDDGGFNVACMARSFPPRDEFAARASHPLIVLADDLDPTKIKQPGPSKKTTAQQVVELLPPEGLTYSEWCASAEAKLKVSPSTFDRRRKEAERSKLIKQQGDFYFKLHPDSN